MKRKRILKEIQLFWEQLEEHYILAKILRILYKKIFLFDIDVRAAAVAYNFTLAVFPTIIFLFSLLAYMPIENFDMKMISFLKVNVPKNLQKDLTELLLEIIHKKREDFYLLVSFLLCTLPQAESWRLFDHLI